MSSDEEEFSSALAPELDAHITQAILDILQRRGENVLMDDLIEAAKNDEWEVSRVLDVLIGLNLVGIEKQRGNHLRNSRAFAYRTGYALPKPLKLSTLSVSLAKTERDIGNRLENVKRLRHQVEKGRADSDGNFLRNYRDSRQFKDPVSDALNKIV